MVIFVKKSKNNKTFSANAHLSRLNGVLSSGFWFTEGH